MSDPGMSDPGMSDPGMSDPGFAAIVLAAGEGSRLKSAHPKVLHGLAGQPLVRHVIDAVQTLGPLATVVVIGQGMDAVARAVAPCPTAIQSPPQGTADAVRAARTGLAMNQSPEARRRLPQDDACVRFGGIANHR